MGVTVSTGYNRWQHPDVTPEPNTVPKFDPNYGFTQEREQKGKLIKGEVLIMVLNSFYNLKIT